VADRLPASRPRNTQELHARTHAHSAQPSLPSLTSHTCTRWRSPPLRGVCRAYLAPACLHGAREQVRGIQPGGSRVGHHRAEGRQNQHALRRCAAPALPTRSKSKVRGTQPGGSRGGQHLRQRRRTTGGGPAAPARSAAECRPCLRGAAPEQVQGKGKLVGRQAVCVLHPGQGQPPGETGGPSTRGMRGGRCVCVCVLHPGQGQPLGETGGPLTRGVRGGRCMCVCVLHPGQGQPPGETGGPPTRGVRGGRCMCVCSSSWPGAAPR